MKNKEIVLGAIIGAIATVIVTAIMNLSGVFTKWVATETFKMEIAKDLSADPTYREILKGDPGRELPIGSIIASMMKPEVFYKTDGGDLWHLADGSTVPGTLYAMKIGHKIPDLRSLFLRGHNSERKDQWRDPDGDRSPGIEQNNTVGSHSHELILQTTGTQQNNPGQDYIHTGLDKGPNRDKSQTEKTGDLINVETRPNNAAVYYYIKIR